MPPEKFLLGSVRSARMEKLCVREGSHSSSSAPALPEVDSCGEGGVPTTATSGVRVSIQTTEQRPTEISKYLTSLGLIFIYLKIKMKRACNSFLGPLKQMITN